MDKKDFEDREKLKQAMINNPDGLIDSLYAVLTMVFEIRSEAFEMAKQELDTIKVGGCWILPELRTRYA